MTLRKFWVSALVVNSQPIQLFVLSLSSSRESKKCSLDYNSTGHLLCLSISHKQTHLFLLLRLAFDLGHHNLSSSVANYIPTSSCFGQRASGEKAPHREASVHHHHSDRPIN